MPEDPIEIPQLDKQALIFDKYSLNQELSKQCKTQ